MKESNQQQSSYNFQGNIGSQGTIDNEGDYSSGLVRQDPQFEYDAEFEIQKPTNAGFEFTMSHRPLKPADVGTTWFSYQEYKRNKK